MRTLSLGWAVLGKWPGTSDEQSVLAGSAHPFTESQLSRITGHSSPGNPPSAAEGGAAALPWAWLFAVSLHGTRYLGVAVRDWSDASDAFHRRIAHTRYFFLPLTEFVRSGLSLADLYATVADVQPPWEDRTAPFGNDELSVEARRAPAGQPLPLRVAATLAAHVVENPVVLLDGEKLSLSARLSALDAIRELLPSGALAWLSSAGWAAGDHSQQLCFAGHARKADTPARIGDAASVPLSDQAARYRDALMQLVATRGRDRVVAHLRAQSAAVNQDIAEVHQALTDLAFSDQVVQAAATGSMVPDHFLRLVETGELDQLSSAQRARVIKEFVRIAPADLLRTAAPVVAEHWDRSFANTLTDAVSSALRDRRWPVHDFTALAELAERADVLPAFVKGLQPPRHRSTGADEVRMVAEITAHLAHQSVWQQPLAEAFARHRKIALRLAHRRWRLNPPPEEFYQRLDAAGPGTEWDKVSRLYRDRDAAAGVTAQDVDYVLQTDANAIPDLLDLARPPEHAIEVLIDYVWQRPSLLLNAQWESGFRRMNDLDTAWSARADLCLLAAGLRPNRPFPATAEHAAAMAAFLSRARESTRAAIVDAIASTLDRHWSADPANAARVLSGLSDLCRMRDGRMFHTDKVLDLVNSAVAEQPGLERNAGMRDWLPHITVARPSPAPRQDSRPPASPSPRMYQSENLVRLTADMAPARVAEIVSGLAVAASPSPVTVVAESLCGSGWKPVDDAWPEFLLHLQLCLIRRGYPEPAAYLASLVPELAQRVGPRHLGPLVRWLADTAAMSGAALVVAGARDSNLTHAHKTAIEAAQKSLGKVNTKERKEKGPGLIGKLKIGKKPDDLEVEGGDTSSAGTRHSPAQGSLHDQ
ncbi:hypothetical protein ACOBQX_22800 [Actinokineospora sp. G85]|uniref:hypothetical protein n=1 Tax=Actinokineospora sp. G85 TaxID=3406626 RepID=UPI003C791414